MTFIDPNGNNLLAQPYLPAVLGMLPRIGAFFAVGNAAKASSASTNSASITITLSGASGVTTYVTGFIVVSGLALASAVEGSLTVTGISATSISIPLVQSPSAPGVLCLQFPDPLPATAQNTAISLTTPAIQGGGDLTVFLFGYQA